jgi:hypothetical protein
MVGPGQKVGGLVIPLKGEKMSNGSIENKPLTEREIAKFVAAWYDALDIHAPLENCYQMLADTELNMDYPDGAIRDFAAFQNWYDRVTNLYFDENHHVQSLTSTIHGTEADCEVLVGWQASWFPAPAPKSKRTSLNALQQWRVRRSVKNRYGVEIVECKVIRFDYAPGFAQL